MIDIEMKENEKKLHTNIIVVDAPAISLTKDENAGEALLKFYRALGWNGSDNLDPCKIRTTKAVFDRLYDTMFKKSPDAVGVGMWLVNYGPGTDDFIPQGKVYLYEGWATPAEPEEGDKANGFQQQAI